MSVFHRKVEWCVAHPSPVFPDIRLQKVLKDNESEVSTFVEFDNKSYQNSLGNVGLWSLESLINSGIDPQFGIHTTGSSRLDGVDDLKAFKSAFESVSNIDNSNTVD